MYFNIGIKHDALTFPVPERRGFQHLSKGPADVHVSEKHV